MDYFLDGVGVSTTAKVPFDHILMQPSGPQPSGYTNTTAIALYLNLLVEMQQAGDAQAITRMEQVIAQLEQAPHWNGLFYWLYHLDGAQLAVPQGGVVSAVDNGNLSFSLAAVSGAYHDSADLRLQQLAARVDALLDKQIRGWGRLYDSQKGLLRAGWDHKTNDYLSYYVDRKANESRLAVIWAVLATQGSATVVPERAFMDMELVTGEYDQDGDYFEPMLTWDGSYFQAMLPALWINESA
ncbi:putative membrane protein precursor [Photobacterium aphoticum]|uniref:Putative membrane protein n=1 Tax=Photobacterium aphoticum TaxID=754436 RepID=A0A090R9X8_9GAMM|nr:putative membrane protein precursor [Photobacterium aphoticum]